MTAIELKSSLHKIIDNTADEETLSTFYTLLSNLQNVREGALWNRLSKEEQEELQESEIEEELEEEQPPAN